MQRSTSCAQTRRAIISTRPNKSANQKRKAPICEATPKRTHFKKRPEQESSKVPVFYFLRTKRGSVHPEVFFHVYLSNVFNIIELDDVFDEVFLWDWLREEKALDHLGSKGEDEVLLLFCLNAFLDGAEGEGVHRFIDA